MADWDALTAEINEFRDARDWRQFHNEKDLALSIVLEASELLENFQWRSADEAVDSAGRKSEIGLQTMKQGRQVKMDLETTLLLNQASIAETPGTTAAAA